MIRVPFISFLAVLTVVACSRNDPVDDKGTRNTAGLPDINAVAPSASGEPHVDTHPATPLPHSAAVIPAAIQGRWGLTPADCMPGRSDAKGLMLITSGELRFYESRAVPVADVTSDTDSMSGNFAFTGEGQSWTKYEALRVDKGRLTRTETNPSASLTYAKCS
jgi:hypothetical protein